MRKLSLDELESLAASAGFSYCVTVSVCSSCFVYYRRLTDVVVVEYKDGYYYVNDNAFSHA